MSIDEQGLRSRLAETAVLADPPRFTAADLAMRVRRTRRRRRGRAGLIVAVSVSVAAVASAITIPLTRGGPNQIGLDLPPRTPLLSYTVTANGQTRTVPARAGTLPLFTITSGERLTMTVGVTVPRPQAMTALWLGITNDVLNGHAHMKPILAASTRVPLRPGAHRFVLHWIVPAGLRPGASRDLSAQWAWSGPSPGKAEQEVAEFAVPQPASAESPAAVARRLHAIALRTVTTCDGARTAWILAVRTTFSKAIAEAGDYSDIADNATKAVYLVLMKGDFALYNGGAPAYCAHASGHYFLAIVDAATFVTLEAEVGNRQPSVQPQTLGPVLNLTSTKPSLRPAR